MTPPENTYAKDHRHDSTTPEGEEGYYRLPLPNRKNHEMFAIADQLLGGSRIHVICEDKKSRMARIPGKMKRKARVRAGVGASTHPATVPADCIALCKADFRTYLQ